MDQRRAEADQRLPVLASAVTLVPGEAILRIPSIQLNPPLIPRNLSHNRGGGYRKGQGIAAGDALLGNG